MCNKVPFIIFLSLTLVFGCAGDLVEDNGNVEQEKVDDWLWAVSWNTNDDQIAAGGTQDTLRLFSSETMKPVDNIPISGTITKVKWHPTKNKLAIATQGEQSRSMVLDLANDERIILDSLDGFGVRAIGWNNSGDLLATGDYSGFLNIYTEDGELLERIDMDQKGLIGLDWNPSQNKITVVGERIAIYDMDTDSIHHIRPREEVVLMLCIAWHPSGDLFVTGDYGDFEKDYPPLLQYWTANGTKIRDIEESKAEFRNLEWSDDGSLLATASESLRLWNEQGDLLKEAVSDDLLWGIDWNTSGTQIVTTADKGRITLWDKDLSRSKELHY